MSQIYVKDFDNWHTSKKIIHEKFKNIVCSEREVWWCSLGVNIGIEEDGKRNIFERPVLIIKKVNARCSWVLPLSSSLQQNIYRYTLTDTQTQVILSQIRTIDNKRLLRKMSIISRDEFSEIINKIIEILSIRSSY